MPAISVRGLLHAFSGAGEVLSNLNFEIEAGDFVSILGPSGCGKSTLLRLIAGFETCSQGKVDLDLQLRSSGKIGFVFQDPQLLPWRTTFENVRLPLEILATLPAPEQEDLTHAALEMVGLRTSEKMFPRQLSGGMRMRASLARALVTRPSLLLLDEPFAALDEGIRYKISEELRKIWFQEKMTILFVTHSMSEAVFLSNRAFILTQKPSHLFKDKTIELPSERMLHLRTTVEYNRVLSETIELYYKANSNSKELA